MRLLLVDDLRIFRDDRGCEVARDSGRGVCLLRGHRNDHVDEIWLDHDLGESDTIRPVVEELERAAADEQPYDIGVIYVHTSSPSAAEAIVRSLDARGYRVRRVDAAVDLYVPERSEEADSNAG